MAPRRAEGDRVKVSAMLSRGAPASLRRCSRVCLTLYVGVPEGLLGKPFPAPASLGPDDCVSRPSARRSGRSRRRCRNHVSPSGEGLVDGVLETVVALLGDTVLLALAAIDAGGAEAVVVQQSFVGVIQSPTAAAAKYCRCAPLGRPCPGPTGRPGYPAQRQEGLAAARPRRSATPSG